MTTDSGFALILSHNMLEFEDMRDALDRRGIGCFDAVRSGSGLQAALRVRPRLLVVASETYAPVVQSCLRQATGAGVPVILIDPAPVVMVPGAAMLSRPFSDAEFTTLLWQLGL